MALSKNLRPIHPFPARMAPELAWEEIPECKGPLRILDPMAGSGTTLVTARLRGHQATGFDRDPLAVLIASAWIGNINAEQVTKKAIEVLDRAKERALHLTPTLAFPDGADDETRTFIKFWFDVENRKQLSALAISIAGVRDAQLRGILWCAFSRLIITKKAGVSLAMDVSHSRPHRKFLKAPRGAFASFLNAVQHITKHAAFNIATDTHPPASMQNADARHMPLKDGSMDLIVTSPPYLNAIDYIRGHKLSLVWMGHSIASLRALRSTNVGTEAGALESTSENLTEKVMEKMCSGVPLEGRQKGMLRQYVFDMRALLQECHRVLVSGGKSVFVVGDCTLRQTFVANSAAVELLGIEVGFQVEAIRRRPLPENRRYLPPPEIKSAGKSLQKRMREEVILTLRK
jgi:tRNA G10  N-methylase Trm11